MELGEYVQCQVCRSPVSAAGRSSTSYVAGISCDHCIDPRTDKQRARYAARRAQIKLAKGQSELPNGMIDETAKNSSDCDE